MRPVRFVSLVAGLVSLTAVVFGVPPARVAQVSAGTPDPTLLPVATTAQVPLTAAYDALNVSSLAAGGWYLDPTTNVKIYKVTSATYPTASPYWGHDYSEGGDEVSMPYNGTTRAVLVRQNGTTGGPWWLVDFTPGVGVSNPRQLTGSLSPWIDGAFAFSNNPATPYYAYVSNGTTIHRFDIRTMTEASGDGWPVTDMGPAWLHQSESDGLFVWMRGPNGTTVVGYEPSTGTLKAYTDAGLNEPRVDRAGRYIGISMTTPRNGLVVWDWQANAITWATPGDTGTTGDLSQIPFAHNASLRRRWVVVDWNLSFPDQFATFTPDVTNSGTLIGGPANGTTVHGNGNWIQHPTDLNDQWALFLYYGGLQPTGSTWLAPGGMVLMTPNGQRRLLGHPYNATTIYNYYSFAKFSPDGQYVLFTSDMNGSGRSDVFLAELPQTASNPVPALSSLSPATTVAGAASFVLTVNGSSFVSGSSVQWSGASRATTFVGSAQLQATILAADVATAGTAQVTVVNPAPGGGTSNSLTFTIGSAVSLAVVKAGSGSGTVTSTPAGITCGTSCSATFVSGTAATLAATPTAGAAFAGWSGGGCSGTGTCTVTLTAATTVTATFNDTTSPTVSITAPTAAATVVGTVSVTATATDNVDVVGVQFKLDGVNLGAEVTAAPYAVSWDTTAAANGAHTLTAVARDASGNTATSAAVSVTVLNAALSADTTPPTVSMTAPTAGATVTGTVTVSASASDNVGVAGVQFKLDGVNLGAEVTAAPYSVSWDTTTAPDAAHTLTAVARDAAGNSATSAPVSVTVSNGTTTTSGAVGYWTFDEGAGTTAADSSGSGNTGTLMNGPTWTTGIMGSALQFDGLGNYVNVPSTAALDAYPLTVAVWLKTSTASGVRGVVNKYLAGSYNGYNVFLNNGSLCAWYLRDTLNYVYDGSGCPFNVTGSNDNQWHHVVYVVDAAGGRLYVDGIQKGSLGWTGTPGAPTTTQPVHIGHYPRAFGGAEYFLGVLDDVRIYNRALSTQDVLALYSLRDTIPPTVSITAPAPAAIVGGTVTVTASATDNVDVVGVQFKLDGANVGAEVTTAPYSVAWNTTTALPRAHTLTAVARDAAGNTATSATVSVTVADTTPPSVSLTAPTAGATVSGTVTVAATATDNVGVVGVQFKLDGANVGAEVTAAAYAVSWDTTTALAGTHTLTAVVRDTAGNTATSAPVSVTVANGTTSATVVTQSAQSIAWTNLVDVTATSNSLLKTSGCDGCYDAGATSQQQIASGDGYAEFTVTETTLLRVAGLTHASTSTNPNTIDFGIRLQSGYAEVRENGVYRADTTVTAGDVFRIAVQSGVVRYSKNGSVFYTSTAAPSYLLFFAAALANLNATVSNAVIAGALSGGAAQLAWTNAMNVTATGNSLLKTSGCDGCYDAGATSQQQIASGDGYAEFTVTETTLLRVAGLTHASTSTNPNTIDFGIRLQSGYAEVRENGVYRADTTVTAGDVFRIAVQSGVVRYSKNGSVFYTSTAAPSYLLFFAAALANLNATVTNAVMAGAY